MRYAIFFIAVCGLAWSAAEVRPQAMPVHAGVTGSRAVTGTESGERRAESGAGAGASLSAVSSSSSGLLIPVVGITQTQLRNTFHERRSGGRSHQAIDILAPFNTPVVATMDGRIRKLFTSKAGGITIYQTDGAEEKIYYYAHLARYADGLHEGQIVSRGDVIGYVGTTGNAPPTTPHLHFAIMILPPTKEWWKGEAIDPYPLLTGRTRAASGATTLR
jgi:murein DD-endopeptidase MepM/ murein hydrolase activator NlpD